MTAIRKETDSLSIKNRADHDLTLKDAALQPGFVTDQEFDRVVDPGKMVKPYVAVAGR